MPNNPTLEAKTEIETHGLVRVHPETPIPLPWREGIKGRGRK
jgi:hypothetical protein